jgi:hypothetical protein
MKRFWNKVNKDGPVPEHKPKLGKCWVWVRALDSVGYGQFGFRGKIERSHRVSYILEHDSIPSGMCILHKCDNRACVRPDHLYAGTRQKNTRDMVNANRQSKGSLHGPSKLTEEEVVEIRRLAEAGIIYGEIIRKLGLDVNQPNLSLVVNRKTWRHV